MMGSLEFAHDPIGIGWSATVELQLFAVFLVIDQQFVSASVQQVAALPEGYPVLYQAVRANDPAFPFLLAITYPNVENQFAYLAQAPSQFEPDVPVVATSHGEKVFDRTERHSDRIAYQRGARTGFAPSGCAGQRDTKCITPQGRWHSSRRN